MERIRAGRFGKDAKALFEGDLSSHGGDHSAADLAFCDLVAWESCDADTIDAVFRKSALMRDKWDEPRGKSTYGEMTVRKAIEGVNEKMAEGNLKALARAAANSDECGNPLPRPEKPEACGEPEPDVPAEAAEAVDVSVETKVRNACAGILNPKSIEAKKGALEAAAQVLGKLVADGRAPYDYVYDKLRGAAVDAGLDEAKSVRIIQTELLSDGKKTKKAEKKIEKKEPEPAPLPAVMDDPFGLGVQAVPDPDEALAKAVGIVDGLAAYDKPEERLRDMATVLKFRGDLAADRILRELRAGLKTAVAKAGTVIDFDDGLAAITVGIGEATKTPPPPMPEETREEIEIVSYLARNVRDANLPEETIRLVVELIERTPNASEYQDAIITAVADGFAHSKYLEGMKARARAAISMACVKAALGAMKRPVVDVPAEYREFLCNLPDAQDMALNRSNYMHDLRCGKLSQDYVLCRMDGELRVLSLRDWVRLCMYDHVYVIEKMESDGQWYCIDEERRWVPLTDKMAKDVVCERLGWLQGSQVASAKFGESVLAAVRGVAKRLERMSAKDAGIVRVACENGIVEADGDGKPALRPIELADHVTTRVNARWHETDEDELMAAIERLKAILRSFFLGDEDAEEKVTALLEAIGSAMLQMHANVCWTFVGSGANGKGVIQRAIMGLVGEESCVTANSARFDERHFLADLRGKSVIICNESRVSDKLDTRIFNAVVTGDALSGRRNFKENVYYTPYATVIIFSNHLPMFSDDSDGPMRRFLVISMNRQFVRADGSRDEGYSSDIDAELAKPIMRDALFRLAFDAVRAAAERGWQWTRPASTAAANAMLREATSPLRTFISDCLSPIPAGHLPAWSAYAQYASWCRDSGIAQKEQLPFGQFITEMEMNARVKVETEKHYKKKLLVGYQLNAVTIERNDRQDKTSLEVALAALLMGVKKMLEAMGVNASPQAMNDAIKRACEKWKESYMAVDEEGKPFENQDWEKIEGKVRDRIVSEYDQCLGFLAGMLDNKEFAAETEEDREARYAALAAQDGLWLSSMPEHMQWIERVCLAAVRQNPAAFKYALSRGGAQTAEEFLAMADAPREEAV